MTDNLRWSWLSLPWIEEERYMLCSDGRIFDHHLKTDNKPLLLKPFRVANTVRPCVALRTRTGKQINVSVARLMLNTFEGYRPGNWRISYGDSDPSNCSLVNLAWKDWHVKKGRIVPRSWPEAPSKALNP